MTTVMTPAVPAASISRLPSVVAKSDYLFDVLQEEINKHHGIKELATFGHNLQSRPLTSEQLRIFFSSLVAVVTDTPGGILGLALRITDDWINVDPLNATAKAAPILFAAVDEYGLHDMAAGLKRTHHQLFIDVISHWNMEPADLMDAAYIVPEARQLGSLYTEYYRNRPILESLGFHYGSEQTSTQEFLWYLAGFKKFEASYKIKSDTDPALYFFKIHTEVEESHRDMGVEMIRMYADSVSNWATPVLHGVRAYMDGYGALFTALNRALFGSPARSG